MPKAKHPASLRLEKLDGPPRRIFVAEMAQRPAQLPLIQGWDFDGEQVVKPPKGVSHVVLDSPAGLDGKRSDGVS